MQLILSICLYFSESATIFAMQQMYSNTSKILIDAKGNGNLLYLPLDKLMQQGNGSVTVSQPQPAAPAVADPAPTQDLRSRDGQRTRDREGR
jgi:membrane protease subunit HflK